MIFPGSFSSSLTEGGDLEGEESGEAAEVAEVGPGEDLVKVRDVLVGLALLELLLELADLLAPRGCGKGNTTRTRFKLNQAKLVSLSLG